MDIRNLERREVLVKLGQSTSSATSTAKLKIQLKRFLQKDHPSFRYLNQLSQENLKNLHDIIFSGSRYRPERIEMSLANEMFKRFPKSPATVLAFILKSGKIPIDIDLETIRIKTFQETSTESIANDIEMTP